MSAGDGGFVADLAHVPVLEIKLGALVVLLAVTLLFGSVPLCLVRGAGPCGVESGARHRLLGLISCFAGGVFLATCLLDLLPDYLQGISEAFSSAGVTLRFPLPEFIMAMGFFLVLVLEQVVLAFRDQRPPQAGERRSLLAEESDCDCEHRRRRRHGSDPWEDGGPRGEPSSPSALRAFVLVVSLALHSIFEGLAVGLLQEAREVLELCLGLLLHKSIISFSLAFKLARGRLRRRAVAGCLLLFAAMTPLGIGLGVGLAESRASPRHRLARCTLEGLAAGTFIYVTFMEILPHEMRPAANRIPKVLALLAGFAAVTGVLFIKL